MRTSEHHESSKLVSVLVELRAKAKTDRIPLLETGELHDEVRVELESFRVDPNFKPIVMRKKHDEEGSTALTATGNDSPTLLLRGMIPDNKIEELKQQENVIDVFPNPKGVIIPMVNQVDCNGRQPKGTLLDVAEFLEADRLWEKGFKGDDIVIGIVDSGITAEGRADRNEFPIPLVKQVIGGFRQDWGTYTDKEFFHGNMTSTDALGIAPNAELFDIRIFSKEGIEETFIDVVVQAYEWAIQQFQLTGKPQILSNSWGFRGAYPGVTDNPRHPMNRKIIEAIRTGILVLFSAGNCGEPCGSELNCLTRGPSQSIHGINGHKLVMTVGAANIRGLRAGYTAQGPANFHSHKPDFCAPTHFTGYFESDTGTSAACPVAAGVVALLMQAKPSLTQDQAKHVLMETAVDLEVPGWDTNTGSGMIQAHAAFNRFMPVPLSPMQTVDQQYNAEGMMYRN